MCDRQSSFQTLSADQLWLRHKEDISEPVDDTLPKTHGPTVPEATTYPTSLQVNDTLASNNGGEGSDDERFPTHDDIVSTEMRQFRNVHLTATEDLVTSIGQARRILCNDPNNPSALRHLVAWRMCMTCDEAYYSHIRRLTLITLKRACLSGTIIFDLHSVTTDPL